MVEKEWKIKKQVSEDLEEQLLHSYGIGDERKESFFNPDYEKDIHDPFKILDMDKAVDRILASIEKKEKIILYGDYDADGICGIVVFHDFFKKIGFENFDIYIPDRYKEGYGLNMGVVDGFKKQNVDLIITVDCGVSDIEEIKKAQKGGMDVVVVDHHLAQDELPPAVAIVNPQRKKDKYPFKMLCGAAVAFKVVNALIKEGPFNIIEGWSKWLLDLVCVATVADMVPLTHENRAFVFYGLQVLKKTSRPGFLALFKKLKIKQKNITEDDIAFLVAPRINTAGRMGNVAVSFELLVAESPEEAEWAADRLNQKSVERKKMAEQITEEANAEILKVETVPEVLFFGSKNWQPGILGVVANKILDAYNKTVFLWGKGDSSQIKGSARSNGAVNLVELMRIIGDEFFFEYGGHALAAGFTAKEEKIGDLGKALITAFGKSETEEIKDIVWVDRGINLNEVSWGFLKIIEKFGPFGKDHPRPVFLMKDLEVFNVKMFGNGGIHLRLDFKKDDGVISAIGFFMKNGDRFNIQKGMVVDLLTSVEKSTFRGYDELRLRINDLKIK